MNIYQLKQHNLEKENKTRKNHSLHNRTIVIIFIHPFVPIYFDKMWCLAIFTQKPLPPSFFRLLQDAEYASYSCINFAFLNQWEKRYSLKLNHWDKYLNYHVQANYHTNIHPPTSSGSTELKYWPKLEMLETIDKTILNWSGQRYYWMTINKWNIYIQIFNA